MMAVAIGNHGGDLDVGTPKPLFDSKFAGGPYDGFDVSKDGRFLLPMQEPGPAAPITLVVNWQAGLKK